MIHPNVEVVGEEALFMASLGGAASALEAHLIRRVDDGQFIRLFLPADRDVTAFNSGDTSQLLIDQVISFRTGRPMNGGVLLQRRAGGVDVSSHT